MPNPVCAYCWRPALLAFVPKAQEGDALPITRLLCEQHVSESANTADLTEQERTDLTTHLARLMADAS